MTDAAKMFDPIAPEEGACAAPLPAEDEWQVIAPIPEDTPREFPAHRLGVPSTTWPYRDQHGGLLFVICRFETEGGKEIIPLTFGNDGKGPRWRWKGYPAPRPLYGLDRLAAQPDAPVLVTEGEKAADAAGVLFPDYVATTSPGGSKTADKADWSRLRGRAVTIWPDADVPGREYAETVARLCQDAGVASIAIVTMPEDTAEGWDLADVLPDGWTDKRLHDLLDNAEVRPENSPGEGGERRSDTDAVLNELAALSPIEYDRRRHAVAEELDIRKGTLDAEVAKRRSESPENGNATMGAMLADPEPWPVEVNGADLLDALVAAVSRHAKLPDGGAEAIALWVGHAHAHDASQISPILAFLSPEKRCGKTTALTLVQALAPRSLPTANITAAALFRVVECLQPTMLIDEADTFLRGNDELRGVLNSGHSRASAYVLRTVGEDHTPYQFRTWAPKAIALIGSLPDTLADRAIVVRLRRKRLDETVERLRMDRLQDLEPLCRQAARWATDNLDALQEAEPDMPAELNDRAADNWRPLLAIADLAGSHWPATARKVAGDISADQLDEDSHRVTLLADVRAIFQDLDVDRLPSTELVDALGKMEERPWMEWRNGKPITVRQLAKLLKPFGVMPGTIRLASGKTPKGYRREALSDAFSRYLLPVDPPHRHNQQETAENSEIRSATSRAFVADEKSLEAAESVACGGVADETPPSGDEGAWEAEL